MSRVPDRGKFQQRHAKYQGGPQQETNWAPVIPAELAGEIRDSYCEAYDFCIALRAGLILETWAPRLRLTARHLAPAAA